MLLATVRYRKRDMLKLKVSRSFIKENGSCQMNGTVITEASYLNLLTLTVGNLGCQATLIINQIFEFFFIDLNQYFFRLFSLFLERRCENLVV